MDPELILTPTGRLRLRESGNIPPDSWMKRVASAFSASTGAGLFSLAAMRPEFPLSVTVAFWRDFAANFITQLCRMPSLPGHLMEIPAPPTDAELSSLILSAPPMQGGEYLDMTVLVGLWAELNAWVMEQVPGTSEGLGKWLKKHAPMWRQVGRVCFHLAENKNDPDFPFAFMATYAPGLSKSGKVQYRPLGQALKEYTGEKNKKALISLLSPVHTASEKIDFVRELVDSGDIFHPLAWTPAEAYRLLKTIPVLEESGLLVRLPDWWRKRPRPRVSVSIGEKNKGRFGADAMLDFKVGLALGDDVLSENEWRDILSSETGLAYVKGQWVEVDREKLEAALAHWKQVETASGTDGISFIEGMRLLAGAPADLGTDGDLESQDREWSFVNPGKWLSEVLSNLRNPAGPDSPMKNTGFCGTLRPYQETGRDWLWLLSNLGLGACLADDMGLGKTIQVLSLLLAVKKQSSPGKPTLLVLPASLISNWKAEIARFAPSLKTVFIHPSEADKVSLKAIAENPEPAISGADLVLTTYGMVVRQKWLMNINWRLVILDEAQAVKNPSARQTKTVKKLAADARIALTGTPVENRISDLWSLFDFLCPGLLGSASVFKRFVKSLESKEQRGYAPLRNLVQPYILRRLKTDKRIIADLPDKTELKAFCGLSKKQAALYVKSVEELEKTLNGIDGIKRRGLVLAYLMRFKQICNHPSQLLADGEYNSDDSGKFDRLRGICEEIASRQEKVIIFTQFREMTGPIAEFLAGVFGR